MVATVRAVYEGGVLRLLEPVDLQEGQVVELQIPQATSGQVRQESSRTLPALIDEWLTHLHLVFENEASWEEFDAFLGANRFDLPERDLGLDGE